MDDIYTKKPEECAYAFTQHRACEFFPCHKTGHPEDFNCLFCYCPLYTLGERCGGRASIALTVPACICTVVPSKNVMSRRAF